MIIKIELPTTGESDLVALAAKMKLSIAQTASAALIVGVGILEERPDVRVRVAKTFDRRTKAKR